MKLIHLLAVAFATPAAAVASQVPDLLVHVNAPLTEDFASRGEVVQATPVTIRTDLLYGETGALGSRLGLGVIEGEQRTLVLEGVESMPNDGLVWRGSVEGADWSVAFLSVVDDMVAGSIRFDHTLLRLDPDPVQAGVYALTLLDELAYEPCGTGAEHELGAPGATDDEEAGGTYGSSQLYSDVLVAYSPQARSAQGGTAGIQALINLAVTETNLSYTNALVDMDLRLVGTVETAQSETSDMGQVLGRVRSTSDGWYDEVHGLRSQLGADFVAMIVQGGGYCGIAYLMTNVSNGWKTNAFSVTKRSCATGYYSFGHELGHNMGCAHDRQNAGNAAYNYSYGYRTPNNAWRTVMAYSPGTRVPYFSSPDATFNGFQMGIAGPASNSADNGRSIDTAAPTMTGWYCAPPEIYGFGAFTSQFQELRLGYTGMPDLGSSQTFTLDVENGVPGQFGILFYGPNSTETPFLGGYLYVGQPQVRMPPQQLDAQGRTSFEWLPHASPSPGDTYHMQFWMRDPVGNPSGDVSAVSNAVRVDVCN